MIADYQKRARAERDARYALHSGARDQGVALDLILPETRAAVGSESSHYEASLASER